MLELKQISKEYQDVSAVDNLSLCIEQGEFFALLGPSGCGKTTLLRMIGGFESPTSGEIHFDGRRIDQLPPHQRHTNMVFQKYALFPHLSVFENVAFGLKVKKVSPEEIKSRVEEALQLVHMNGFDSRNVTTLSGGQQQRVALARALVNRPKVLLLDEPLSALDLKLRQSMQAELLRIQRKLKITFIFVTHDQDEALSLSDRIAVMNGGRIEQVGTPKEIYDFPKTAFVADFIGSLNSIPSQLVTTPKSDATPGLEIDRPYLVRPEKLRLVSQAKANGIRNNSIYFGGKIEEIIFKGPYTQFIISPNRNTNLRFSSIDSYVEDDQLDNLKRGEEILAYWSEADSYRIE